MNSSPPPLPNEPVPPPLPGNHSNPPRNTGSRKVVIYGIIAALVACVAVVVVFAVTCPDEHQLRQAVYGEVDPRYKFVLETVGRLSRLAGGPGLVFHSHFVCSELDFRMPDGREIKFASGMLGKTHLTPQVQDVKDLLLSIPGADKVLQKQGSP